MLCVCVCVSVALCWTSCKQRKPSKSTRCAVNVARAVDVRFTRLLPVVQQRLWTLHFDRLKVRSHRTPHRNVARRNAAQSTLSAYSMCSITAVPRNALNAKFHYAILLENQFATRFELSRHVEIARTWSQTDLQLVCDQVASRSQTSSRAGSLAR